MPAASEGGASSVSAELDSGDGGGTGAGASAFVGTYIEAAYRLAALDCLSLYAVQCYTVAPYVRQKQQQVGQAYANPICGSAASKTS